MKKSYPKKFEPQETVDEVLKYPIYAWEEVGLRQETMEYFGFRTALSEKEPGKVVAVYFPAYSKDGKKIVGFQKKNLEIPKDETGHFTAVGSVRNTCMLYGQKQCQHGGKKLFVCEGPKDMASAFQALTDVTRGTKWEHLKPNVTSIVNGTSNADKSIAHNEEFVKSFDQVVVCMDNDQRLPIEPENVIRGKEAEDLIGSYLCSNNILVPNYPSDRNDLNEILMNDGPKALNDLLLWNVKPFQAEKIITFDEAISFEDSIAPVQQGILLDNFPLFNEAMLGLRPHELTTITGISGCGKSTLAFEWCFQTAEKGHKVGLIMLEDPIKKTQQRISARYLKVNPRKYFLNPTQCGKSIEDLKRAWEYSVNPDNFVVLNHFGSISSKVLMSKIKSLTASGCEIILLDHASIVVSGRETNDERKDLDVLYTELAAFRAAHPVHLIVVSHIDKRSGSQELGRPEKPKWNYLNINSLRGTAGIPQLSCNVVLLHNEVLPSGRRGRVMVGIGKGRSMGVLGDMDIVSTNWKTGLFEDATDWEYDVESGYMVPRNRLEKKGY